MLGTCYAEFSQWYKSSEGTAKQANMRAKLGLKRRRFQTFSRHLDKSETGILTMAEAVCDCSRQESRISV